MNKKVTKIRKCIVCGEQFQKNELIRIVKNKDGEVKIDHSERLNGRGAYICKNNNCLETAIKKKLLNRHLKTNVDSQIYKELETM